MNCRNERQLTIARTQTYSTSNERPNGSASGEVSKPDKAAMLVMGDRRAGVRASALGRVIPRTRFLTAVHSPCLCGPARWSTPGRAHAEGPRLRAESSQAGELLDLTGARLAPTLVRGGPVRAAILSPDARAEHPKPTQRASVLLPSLAPTSVAAGIASRHVQA